VEKTQKRESKIARRKTREERKRRRAAAAEAAKQAGALGDAKSRLGEFGGGSAKVKPERAETNVDLVGDLFNGGGVDKGGYVPKKKKGGPKINKELKAKLAAKDELTTKEAATEEAPKSEVAPASTRLDPSVPFNPSAAVFNPNAKPFAFTPK